MKKSLSFKERLLQSKEQANQQREKVIRKQLDDLQSVRFNIKQFKQQLAQATLPKQQKQLEFRLQQQRKIEEVILGRLKKLNYTEKRGRPKKEVVDTYKANRVKFTAHLQKDHMIYVKQLQANGQIQNISAFLDELIADHQKNNG